MTIISKLCYDDLSGLKQVYDDAFENSCSDLEQMKEIYKKTFKDERHIVLCAKTEGRITGSVMGVVCYELFGKCKPFMVVENVAVLKEFRRQGIARELMLKLEENARILGCSAILFVSSDHRKGAHKLYESLGYGSDKVNGYRKRL